MKEVVLQVTCSLRVAVPDNVTVTSQQLFAVTQDFLLKGKPRMLNSLQNTCPDSLINLSVDDLFRASVQAQTFVEDIADAEYIEDQAATGD